jgi:hypothetical protein
MPAENSDRSVVVSRMLGYTRAYLKPRNALKKKQDELGEEAALTRSAASRQAIETRESRHGESLLTTKGKQNLQQPK